MGYPEMPRPEIPRGAVSREQQEKEQYERVGVAPEFAADINADVQKVLGKDRVMLEAFSSAIGHDQHLGLLGKSALQNAESYYSAIQRFYNTRAGNSLRALDFENRQQTLQESDELRRQTHDAAMSSWRALARNMGVVQPELSKRIASILEDRERASVLLLDLALQHKLRSVATEQTRAV